MFNFKKIFGVAGAVMVFTGLAYGQATVTCTNPTADQGNVVVRAEGQAEMVSNLTFTCNNISASAATVTITDNVSAPITSKVLTAATSTTEAVLVGASTVQGILVGTNQLNFAVTLAPGASTFQLTNVRINASAASGTITESLSGITSNTGGPALITQISTTPLAVATPLTGLVGVKLSTAAATGLTLCTTYTQQAAMTVSFSEGFGDAFKTAGSAATNTTVGYNFASNTETGYVASGFANVANSGTKVKIVFAGVPSGMTLFVPLTLSNTSLTTGGVLTLVASETSSTPATTNAVTLTGGAGVAVYEYSIGTGQLASAISTSETFQVPVTFSAAANTVPLNAPAFTAAVSLAPVNAAPGTTIPSFVAGTSAPLTGPTLAACTTTLLFPFTTNQVGYDTGIAISNTSTGLGASPQSGTCSLNFYGANAPAAPVVTASVASGAVYAQSLSSIAAGFQGYVLATCQFQYAHGFAFISSGLGSSSGIAEGYLALVVPTGRALTNGSESLQQ